MKVTRTRSIEIAAGVLVAAMIAAVAVLVVAPRGAALGSKPRHARLAALAPGRAEPNDGDAEIERVTLGRLIATSDVVFVGTAVAKGGPEEVSPDIPGASAGLTAHRIRFHVASVLRGDVTDPIDVSTLDLGSDLDPYAVGKTYLVFGKATKLGTTEVPALITNGYFQGAFLKDGSDSASNNSLGRVSLRAIAADVRGGKR
jgi:hypothetical protein